MTDRPNDWLTDLGHEIRAPAEGMIGMIRLLLETQLGSDQRQIAESVRESAERLLVLAGSMLGTDGAGQDRETSGDDAFDLAALVEDAAAPAASRAALTAECALLSFGPDTRWDPTVRADVAGYNEDNIVRFGP